MKRLFALLLVMAALLPAKAFRADTITVATKYLANPANVQVIVPEAAKQPDAALPVVYLLNGYDGTHLQWTKTQPRLGQLADQFGFIMVLPDGLDSWYWDSPVDPSMQMESYIIKDLVPFIDANYPTATTADKRAISGFSMGGHGALWLAMHHPDVFANVGSMSGGVDIRPFPKNWKMALRLGKKDENPARWDDYTVATHVPMLKDAKLNIIFDCGVDDFFAPVNDKLHQDLLEAKVPHDYISRPGAHTHEYWANSLLYHLLFFDTNFSK